MIRFNPALEELAHRRIAEGDLRGARSAVGLLMGQLDLSVVPARRQETALLLIDLLLDLSRRVHEPRKRAAFQSQRLAILEAFSGSLDPEEIRRRSLALVDEILSALAARNSDGGGLIDRAKALVRNEYARPLSLARVAARLGVSPGYLSRLFRRESGVTLTAYIHSVRLQHALLLLAAGGRSLSEVSYLVGYHSYRDFYRNFMKHEKASPRQARHRLAGAITGAGT